MPFDEASVRERAGALCDALAAGDVERAIGELSEELKRNLGEVLGLFPLPVVEAEIDSIEHGGSAAFVVVLRLLGETEEVRVQTRWKDRDGAPKVVEASHLSRQELAPVELPLEAEEAMAGEPSTEA
jgi:hypothetical protein